MGKGTFRVEQQIANIYRMECNEAVYLLGRLYTVEQVAQPTY